MFWKKISKSMRYIGLSFAIAGAFGAGFALACEQIIPIAATKVMVTGLIIALIALLWETYLDELFLKREMKRIRR